MSFVNASTAEIDGYQTSSQTPFSVAVTTHGEEPAAEAEAFEAPVVAETPFLSAEALSAGARLGAGGGLEEMLAELYDHEFDHALAELSEAAAEAAGSGGAQELPPDAEGYVREWLAPLHRDAEAMLEAIGETLGDRDLATVHESEVDELLAPHEPLAPGANPVFENFLGGFFNKIKGAVKGAVNLAKKGVSALGKLLPINLLLDKVKQLVRPLLERVLQMALNKLPPALRPAAEALKAKLLGETSDEADLHETLTPTTVVPASEIQQEFDVHTASLLLTPDQESRDAVPAAAWAATAQAEDPLGDLAAARRRFEDELRALPPGGDPGPAIEGFLPVVAGLLPLLKIGVSLIGRDRIVRFLAGFMAPLIKPFIGDQAPALSQAIASAGLGLMSLEAPADPAAAAAGVLSGTVETTARRVFEQGGETLEHPELLEAAAASAFDEAAAEHFPPAMLRPSHRPVHLGAHPHHHHHHGHEGEHPHAGTAGAGMWVRLPRGHTYRRYTRPLTAHLSPTVARQIKVFGGTTLEAWLRDRAGVTNGITVPAHVYEAGHGATLGRIAASELRTKGLGSARAAWKLLPLTPEAAGLLFGEPGLGRAVDPAFLADPHRLTVGQRFYYLELPRRHASPAPDAGAAPASPTPPPAPAAAPAPASSSEVAAAAGRSTQVDVRVEPHEHRIVVALYLAEADAQEAAAQLRSHATPAVTKLVRERLAAGLEIALSADHRGHLRWVQDTGHPQHALRGHGKTPAVLGDRERARRFRHHVLARAAGAMADALIREAPRLIGAAERPPDGLTLRARLDGIGPHSHAGDGPARVEILAGWHRA